MAGGRSWTAEEDAFIKDLIAGGASNKEALSVFNVRFQERGKSAFDRRVWQVKEPPPQAPEADGKIRVDVDENSGTVMVLGSSSIKSPEELFEASGLDPKVWEICGKPEIKKWDVAMKMKDKHGVDQPCVVPAFGITIKVQKNWSASELPSPLVVKCTRPKKVRPSEGDFVSVHFGDEHFPHHDERAINLLYQVLDYVNPGFVCAHGDVLDCETIGRWPQDPMNKVGLQEEVVMGANHLGIVEALSPNAELVFLEGNHEDRLRKAIWQLSENRIAGQILKMPQVQEILTWKSLLGLQNWHTVSYTGAGGPNHYLLFDRMILKHGDTVRPHSGASAKAEYTKYNKGGMSGHTHRRGSYEHRDFNGTHAWFEIGLLGSIREAYVAHADWQQGINVVSWSADRKQYGVEEVRIHHGVAYFRGKRFTGDSTAFR